MAPLQRQGGRLFPKAATATGGWQRPDGPLGVDIPTERESMWWDDLAANWPSNRSAEIRNAEWGMGNARRGSGKPTISISLVLFIFYVVRSGCKLKSSRNSSIKLNNRSAESKQKTIGIRYVRNVKKFGMYMVNFLPSDLILFHLFSRSYPPNN